MDLDIANNDFDRATSRVKDHARKLSDNAGLHFLQAKIEAAQNKWPQAEAELLKTLALDGNFSAAYGLLASVYVATDRLPQAVARLEASLSQKPQDVQALMTLGLVYERMNDFAKASEVYEKLLSNNPDTSPAVK